MHNPESVSENEMHKIFWNWRGGLERYVGKDFIERKHYWSIGSPNPHQRTSPRINKEKKILSFTGFCGNIVKLREKEELAKYLDLAWKLKKLWNMKVTVIAIINVLLGIILKKT